jgi:hypothetical protein
VTRSFRYRGRATKPLGGVRLAPTTRQELGRAYIDWSFCQAFAVEPSAGKVIGVAFGSERGRRMKRSAR